MDYQIITHYCIVICYQVVLYISTVNNNKNSELINFNCLTYWFINYSIFDPISYETLGIVLHLKCSTYAIRSEADSQQFSYR